MRDLLLTGILMLFAEFSGLSQTITVVDHEDLKPIPDVAVLNESNTRFIYTNRSGKVDISLFGEKETSTIAEKIPQLALVGIKRLAKSVSPTYDWIYAR